MFFHVAVVLVAKSLFMPESARGAIMISRRIWDGLRPCKGKFFPDPLDFFCAQPMMGFKRCLRSLLRVHLQFPCITAVFSVQLFMPATDEVM